ncbi:MAG: hypothetical protein FJX29_10560 [Alphaproteobacteria bacterium]|nr:hypothetical protein [Alphaproteobacteria bacterium]
MASIPGKSCGPCNMCCKILVIEDDDLKKDAGPLCKNCINGNGCKIYKKRPQTCRDYECEWLQERELGPHLRPDKTGTILQIDPDSLQYQAVCDPATPMAWRKSPLLFKHLVVKAKEGETVIAKSGLKSWRIYPNGNFAPYGE